ncbi:MAG TPA: hypothetical protein VGO86_14740 [Candidatus Dormibacteraeota bacterium]
MSQRQLSVVMSGQVVGQLLDGGMGYAGLTYASERRLSQTAERVLVAMDAARQDAAREGFESSLLDEIWGDGHRRAGSLLGLA